MPQLKLCIFASLPQSQVSMVASAVFTLQTKMSPLGVHSQSICGLLCGNIGSIYTGTVDWDMFSISQKKRVAIFS